MMPAGTTTTLFTRNAIIAVFTKIKQTTLTTINLVTTFKVNTFLTQYQTVRNFYKQNNSNTTKTLSLFSLPSNVFVATTQWVKFLITNFILNTFIWICSTFCIRTAEAIWDTHPLSVKMDQLILNKLKAIWNFFPTVGRTFTTTVKACKSTKAFILHTAAPALDVTDPYSENPTQTFRDYVRIIVRAYNNLTSFLAARHRLAFLGFEQPMQSHLLDYKINNRGILTSTVVIILGVQKLTARLFYSSIWFSWVFIKASFNCIISARLYLLACPVAAGFILQQASALNVNWQIWLGTVLVSTMPVYIVYQTVTFFHKTYQYSRYTTQTQRFWKRALFLFWSIEGFLFGILVYLWLISPEQTSTWFNHRGQLQSGSVDCYALFISNLPLLLLLLLWKFFLLAKKELNTLQRLVVVFVSAILLVQQLINEYTLFVAALSSYNATTSSFKSQMLLEASARSLHSNTGVDGFNSNASWASSTTENATACSPEANTARFFKIFIVLVKFWHIVFIAAFFLFFVNKFLETGSFSYDMISSIAYNFLYLVVFNVATWAPQIKAALHAYITQIPKWYAHRDVTDISAEMVLFETMCVL